MFTFKVIKNYKDLPKEYFEFRYKIIHDELKLVKDNKNRIDSDIYDPYSIHFLAYKEDRICATTRLIINLPFEYPTPKYMNIDLDLNHSANFAELSRVFIDPSVRNLQNSKEIMYRFIKDIYPYLVEYEVDFIYAAMEKKFIRLLKIINIDFQIIGKKGEFYGYRYPCITTKKGLAGKNPYLKNF